MTILAGRQAASDHTTRKIRTAAKVLSALLSLLLGFAALAACAPSTPARIAPTPTAQATATATAVPRLVYQADWSHGLAGWAHTPGWTVSGAVLQSDTGIDRQITLPFRPVTPNYAVEFRLRIVSLAPGAGTQYALRVDPAAGVDGFVALVEHVTVPGTVTCSTNATNPSTPVAGSALSAYCVPAPGARLTIRRRNSTA